MTRALRAWALSVLTCVVTAIVAVNALEALVGRWPPTWHNIIDLTAAVTVVFAMTTALLFVPAFLLLGRIPWLSGKPRRMAIAGALLAPTIVIAFRVTFAEFGDPHTVMGWIRHFVSNPGELGASIALAVPAAAFGLVFCRRGHPVTERYERRER